MRGRPRARLIRTGSVGDMGVSSTTDSSLTSANCSSVSSSFGTMSVELVRVFNRDSDCVSELLKMLESKLGVVIGESLADDIEGCGEELVLKRVCALGGGWPKDRVEIIQSNGKGFSYRNIVWLTSGVHFARAQTVANGAMIADLHKMLHSLGHKGLSAQFACNSIVHTVVWILDEVHHLSVQDFVLAVVGIWRMIAMPQVIVWFVA
jgi:hypothetical protein